MKDIADIRSFYETDLLPDLAVLERQRLTVLKKVIAAGLLIIVPAGVFSYFIRHPLPVLFGTILYIPVMKFLSSGYVFDFKGKVIEKLVRFIDPGLRYSKSGYIPRSDFMLSNIFRKTPDRYTGDDLVAGRVGDTEIRFSEIDAEYETHDSRGRSRYSTIFKGLFFTADFNKKFRGMTVVLPDVAERLLGSFGTMLQSAQKGRGELVKLEDVQFERIFAVYSTDQIEARYILSTSLMKRIVDFQKKHGKRLYISFIGNRIFIALSYSRCLFEPRLFRTLLDFQPIKTYFEDLRLAVGIVEDLNLNLRIWS